MHVLDQQCPRCGATDCKLSRTGLLRFLLWPTLFRPVRCNRCRHRFWRFRPTVSGRTGRRRRRSTRPGSSRAGD